MLGHRFAAEAARNRTNGRTYDGAYRVSSERASRCTSSNAACRYSKPYSNRVRAWCACDWVGVRSKRSCIVIFHIRLRCTVKYGASILARPRPSRFIFRSVAHIARLAQCQLTDRLPFVIGLCLSHTNRRGEFVALRA
jgi:hypothetical protein